MQEVIAALSGYLRRWRNYFAFCVASSGLRASDGWTRRWVRGVRVTLFEFGSKVHRRFVVRHEWASIRLATGIGSVAIKYRTRRFGRLWFGSSLTSAEIPGHHGRFTQFR